jgi:hypothetical protein
MILGAVALLQPLLADCPRPPPGLRSAVELASDKPSRKLQVAVEHVAITPARPG